MIRFGKTYTPRVNDEGEVNGWAPEGERFIAPRAIVMVHAPGEESGQPRLKVASHKVVGDAPKSIVLLVNGFAIGVSQRPEKVAKMRDEALWKQSRRPGEA